MMSLRSALIASSLLMGMGGIALAQDGPPGAISPAFAKAMEPTVERPAVSSLTVARPHKIRIGGKMLRYQSIVTEFPLAGTDGQPAAVAVTYAYVVEQTGADAAKRPVTFVFNGGPGASSLPLHLDGLGPRHIAHGKEGLEDNADSPLDVTDLVFIDPVGTGVSAPIKGKDGAAFWSSTGDARSVIDIIARWSTANGRTASPKIIFGESYGTIRALTILREDMKERRVAPGGVVLTSLAIGGMGDMSPVGLLPTFATVAWYHERVPRNGRTVEAHYAEALAFAQTNYATALLKGDRLTAAERSAVAQRMSALIGIPAAQIEKAGLILSKPDYMASLLGNGMRTGQLDARAKREIAKSDFRPPFDDPSMTLGGEKSDLIGTYLRDELGYQPPIPYRSLNLAINFGWDYGSGKGNFRPDDMRSVVGKAAQADPHLKIMSIGAYFDITTPAYPGEYVLDHSGMPLERRTSRIYPTGHSVLEDRATRPQVTADFRSFVASVLQGVSKP